MSAVSNVWRQLVQRRLWPVAILLIAGLAAVPLTLAEEPDTAPAPPPAASPVKDELAIAPIVTAASTADRPGRRRVLGTAKNPFAVPEEPKRDAPVVKAVEVEPSREAASAAAAEPAPSTGTSAPAAPAPAPAPGAEAPETPAPPAKAHDKHDLTVRFGSGEGELERQTLDRLQPLPSADAAILVYLGVSDDGKAAVFLLDQDVEAVGDGECRPTPEECEVIRLRAGETEFLDVKDETGAVIAQYQLDLVKIHGAGAASAKKAKKARIRAAMSAAGARALSARLVAAATRLP